MKHPEKALSRIIINSPCKEDWSAMSGDERKRLCARCNKHVHNLSAMSREDAVQLLSQQSRICVRLYRRPDGTVLTNECPAGKRKRWSLRALYVLLSGVVMTLPFARTSFALREEVGGLRPAPTVKMNEPTLDPEIMGDAILGEIASPPEATPQPEVAPVVPAPAEEIED